MKPKTLNIIFPLNFKNLLIANKNVPNEDLHVSQNLDYTKHNIKTKQSNRKSGLKCTA